MRAVIVAVGLVLLSTVSGLARSEGPICSFNARTDVYAMWRCADRGGVGDPTSYGNMVVYLMSTGRWPLIRFGDGMGQPWIVFVTGHENASIGYPEGALRSRNPRARVVADIDWIEAMSRRARANWGVETVFAHELGHLLYQHTPATGRTSQVQELEADEFAGYALHRVAIQHDLDISLGGVQAIFEAIAPQHVAPSDSHPDRARRLAAVERGWQAGGR